MTRNAPQEIEVSLVAWAVDHRGAKNDCTTIQKLLRSQLGLAVWRIGIRRLAAGEVDEAWHLAVASVEDAHREANVYVEVALWVADLFKVMRLAGKVDNSVN